MASNTFHLFPNLPKEIQDLIWNAAVRPVPGTRYVHRFMVLGSQEPEHSFSGHLLDFTSFGVTCAEDHNLNDHTEGGENSAGEKSSSSEGEKEGGVFHEPASPRFLVPGSCTLAIPYDALDGGPNDSVYALDSGLWMACKASRAAMERRFTKNEWWSEAEYENAPERLATCGDYNQEKDATHTASYKNYDDEYTHITINHDRDLFCLDSRHLGSLDWLRYSVPDFPAYMEVSEDGGWVANPSFLGPNIAIDYDPYMFDQWLPASTHLRRPDVEWNAMHLSHMVELFHHRAKRTLWFIDYRLRPIDPDYARREILSGESVLRSSDGQERAIFRSNELVLIEAKPEDRDKWYIDTSGYQSRGAMYTAFDFFKLLARSGYGSLEIDGYRRLRVLACQAAPDKTLRPRLSDAVVCPRDSSCKFCGRTDDVA
ncbi:2EXR domain-containing protein [Fusarium sp. Ph1]|nr:2EXR domain-containing protein [Fusarium sp. Ph1]